jgi:hypothetical protein
MTFSDPEAQVSGMRSGIVPITKKIIVDLK